MITFIETIKIESGSIKLFELHKERVSQTSLMHNFKAPNISINELLDNCNVNHKRVKCRIEYSSEGILNIEYSPYELRMIGSLKIVGDDDIKYNFKYGDRSKLDYLRTIKGECDDIIIIQNGLVTDCSYANLVFKKGENFYTPKSYLLNGTRRRELLIKHQIEERDIPISEISQYESVMLINGMIELGEVAVDCCNISK